MVIGSSPQENLDYLEPIKRGLEKKPYLFPSALLLLILIPFFLGGCLFNRPYKLSNIAKSEVNMVIDLHLNEITRLIEQLAVKLYKRNPGELKKTAYPAGEMEDRIKKIVACKESGALKELHGKKGIEAMLLSFEENFKGDRVFALMAGLYTMILNSYNNRCESFIINQLNQQKLYNSARNIEVLVWRLKTRKNAEGQLFFLTNETEKHRQNLSFERLFGKMIAIQDMTALIVADQTNRIINRIVHFTGMSFMPL